MPTTKFLPYAKQSITTEDIEEVRQALTQPIITRGASVTAFEEALADYCQAAYCVSFNSGSSALQAAYFAADIGSNDRILSTPNTFVATIGAGMQRGATPVFVDIERETGNLALDLLELNIKHPSSRGKTIVVPVHYSGIPVDMESLEATIADINTIVIEDAAHALGSHYKDGSKVGSCRWSQMTMFSFHPAKIMTTGEGGAVTTNSEHLYRALRLFRDNGIERDPAHFDNEATPWHYEVVDLTGNYHLTDFQAALGLNQLNRLDEFVVKRQRLLKTYQKCLEPFDKVKLLRAQDEQQVVHHLCAVHIDFESFGKTRQAVMQTLKERGVGTQVHYIPLYRHPFFVKRMGDICEYFPESEYHYAQTLSLPLYYDLTDEDVEYIVESLFFALRPV